MPEFGRCLYPAVPGSTMRSFLGIIFIFLLGGIVGCERSSPEGTELIILQTGRLRGNVYPLSLQKISPLQHYQYIAGYVADVRAEAKEKGASVLLVDLGDSLSGSFAAEATEHENMVTFFNDLGYDALLLGNLDNNITPGTLAQLDATILAPFVRPDGSPPLPGVKRGALFEKEGITIFLLPNFYGDTNPRNEPQRFPAWFGPGNQPVVPIRDYTLIKESFGSLPSDALGLFGWMKFESPNRPPEPFLESLRSLGIDLILAHRIYSGDVKDIWADAPPDGWNPPVSENILRNNGGFTLARTDLELSSDGWVIKDRELLPMTANTAEPDSAIVAQIAEFEDEITTQDFPVLDLASPASERQILEWMLAALGNLPDVQAAAYSIDSVRSKWPDGQVRASQVFNSVPWTSPLCRVQLPADKLTDLEEIANLELVHAPLSDDAEATITLATSKFFGILIRDRLGLQAGAVTEIPGSNEFKYFAEFLRERADVAAIGLPSGWKE